MTAQRTNTKKRRWPPGKAKLKALIETAIVDAYDESEQRTGFYTMLDEHLILHSRPRSSGCQRGRSRLAISIFDLPRPGPRPMREAFRQ